MTRFEKAMKGNSQSTGGMNVDEIRSMAESMNIDSGGKRNEVLLRIYDKLNPGQKDDDWVPALSKKPKRKLRKRKIIQKSEHKLDRDNVIKSLNKMDLELERLNASSLSYRANNLLSGFDISKLRNIEKIIEKTDRFMEMSNRMVYNVDMGNLTLEMTNGSIEKYSYSDDGEDDSYQRSNKDSRRLNPLLRRSMRREMRLMQPVIIPTIQ